jgi:hypothetical protein
MEKKAASHIILHMDIWPLDLYSLLTFNWMNILCVLLYSVRIRHVVGKGKFRPRTGHEVPVGL